jgi:hypothetical protein
MPDQLSQSDKHGLSRTVKQTKQRKTSHKQSSSNTGGEEKIREDVESIKQLLHGMKSYLRK